MPSTDFLAPQAPSAIATPPAGYYGRFIGNGTEGTIAGQWYLMGPGPARTVSPGLAVMNFARESFAAGAGPFTLAHAPNGLMPTRVFADGLLQPTTGYTIVGTTFTPGALNTGNYLDFTVEYTW